MAKIEPANKNTLRCHQQIQQQKMGGHYGK